MVPIRVTVGLQELKVKHRKNLPKRAKAFWALDVGRSRGPHRISAQAVVAGDYSSAQMNPHKKVKCL